MEMNSETKSDNTGPSLKQSKSETEVGNNSENLLHLADVNTTPQETAENSEHSGTGKSTSGVSDEDPESLRKAYLEIENENGSEKHLHSAKYMNSKPEAQTVSQSVIVNRQEIAVNSQLTEMCASASETINLRTKSLQQSQSETDHRNDSENQLHSAEDVGSKPKELSQLKRIFETEEEDRLEHDTNPKCKMFLKSETQPVSQSVIGDQQELSLYSETYKKSDSSLEICDQAAQILHQVKSEVEVGKNFENPLHSVEGMDSKHETQRLSQSLAAGQQRLADKIELTQTAVSASEIFGQPAQSLQETPHEIEDGQNSNNKFLRRNQIPYKNPIAREKRRYNLLSGEKEKSHTEKNEDNVTIKQTVYCPTANRHNSNDNSVKGNEGYAPQRVTTKGRITNNDVDNSRFRVGMKATHNPNSKPTEPTETKVNEEKSNQNAGNNFGLLDYVINKGHDAWNYGHHAWNYGHHAWNYGHDALNYGYEAWNYFNSPPRSDLETCSSEPKKSKDPKNSYRVGRPNIKTLNDAVTYFEMHEMYQSLDASLEEVRRRRVLASEHEEMVRRVDKDLQKQCLKFHPDRIRNRGGPAEEICNAEKLQAALNITRTVISMMSKEFLEDIHIQYKYEFFSQMQLSAFGTEDNIRERICEVLQKIGLLSEIIQDNIVGQVQKFIKCCQSCLDNFIDADIDNYEESRDFAIFHLRKCIEEYLKLDEEFQNVQEQCRDEGLDYLNAVLRAMALEKSKDLKFLQKLESNKHSLTATLDIFARFSDMDDYFVLPFAYYLNIVNMGALILRKKFPPKKKLQFVLKKRDPQISSLSSVVYEVAKERNLKPLMSLISAYNIIWCVEGKHIVEKNEFGVYKRIKEDEVAERQRFNVILLEVKDFLADKFKLNFYDVRSSKLHLMEKLAKFKVEDTSVYRKAEEKISRHMEDFKKESEEKRRELSEMKRTSEELQNAMKAKSMRLDEMFEALARNSNGNEEMNAAFGIP